MSEKGNRGAAKLAAILDNRMSESTEGQLTFDFGQISSGYSLVTNTFPVPIPKSEYSVCRHISGISTGTASKHSHSLPKLAVGDRVLVVWVQEEPVVIDVIKKASSL